MNKRDLVRTAYESALRAAKELAERYTCPVCRNDYLYDPDTKSCESCAKRTARESKAS